MHVLHAFMLCLRFVLVDLCMQICPSLVHLCMLRMRPLTTYISACSILVRPAPDACMRVDRHACHLAGHPAKPDISRPLPCCLLCSHGLGRPLSRGLDVLRQRFDDILASGYTQKQSRACWSSAVTWWLAPIVRLNPPCLPRPLVPPAPAVPALNPLLWSVG